MAKNIIEDVKPPRSIRDVHIPDSRTVRPGHISPNTSKMRAEAAYDIKNGQVETKHPTLASDEEYTYETDYSGLDNHTTFNPTYILWGIAVVCIAAISFIVIGLFSSATINITPKVESAVVNTSIAISKNSELNSSSVEYQLLTLKTTESVVVPAEGQSTVNTKASGQIIIYNNWSSSPQTLVKNTRFQVSSDPINLSKTASSSSSGLIYRILNQIVIPGKKGNTPGSITVTVYADEPGPVYNIGLSDFTIPGFSSSKAKFSAFYARSVTPISGGFSGVVPQVRPADLSQSKKTIDGQMTQDLMSKAISETPDQFVFLSGAATTSFISNLSTKNPSGVSTASIGTSTAILNESATLTAIVFSKTQLSNVIAQNVLPGFSNTSVNIADPSKLQVMINPNAWQATTSVASFSGNAQFIWQYSTDDLKSALLGRAGSDMNAILRNFPAIAKADVAFHPFWSSTFPKDPKRINIIDDNAIQQ